MADSRWFRLNCDWWESEWVSNLSPSAQLAWVKFLCRVKTHGCSGMLKRTSERHLAYQWNQDLDSVLEMIKAALDASAIQAMEAGWLVTGWSKYQQDSTGAARQERYRGRKAVGDNASNALHRDVTATETETETRKKTKTETETGTETNEFDETSNRIRPGSAEPLARRRNTAPLYETVFEALGRRE